MKESIYSSTNTLIDRVDRHQGEIINELTSVKAEDNSEGPPLKRQKLNQSPNLICPITKQVFKDPVIISDGNTYEREAIVRYLSNNNTSPITRQPVNKDICIPNRAIKSTIEEAHKNTDMLFDIPENKSVQTRNIFYNENINLICFEDTNEPVLSSMLLKISKYGNIYCGAVKAGKQEGHGVMTFPNGSEYDGEWKAGKMEGHAVVTYSDGNKYTGEYKNGLREGHGVMTLADGSNYDGEWKAGKKEGLGVMTYNNGSIYNGKWKNDCHYTTD